MRDAAPQIDTRDHLADAERRLAWTRRAALLGWGIILYWREGGLQPSAIWAVYAGGLVYMALLHTAVRRRAVTRATAWIATVCDSLLTYGMCALSGGAASPMFPFVLFTTLAGAFRFGPDGLARVLLLNGAVAVALELGGTEVALSRLLLSLFSLGFAGALGAMLAGWARDNLRIAHARSESLEIERDRSNALLRRLVRAGEEERQRLAEELHDRMGPSLFHLRRALETCLRRADGDTEAMAELQAVERGVDACSADVRSLMNELRPTVLDHFGLSEALSEYLTAQVGSAPFAIDAHLDARLQAWSSRQDAMLFRLVQEAMFNVRKHAHASRVAVSLAPVGEDVELSIADDGCGFDPARVPSGHLGLRMMRERAESAGGSLEIRSASGRGTTIRVVLPASAPA
jgi:two-component system NarL family sensor kinase